MARATDFRLWVRAPGALPSLEVPDPVKYSVMQKTVVRVLSDFLESGFGNKAAYAVLRVGIVAQSRIFAPDAPPGIRKFLDDLEKATGNPLIATNGSLLSRIATREGGQDQCHHSCKFNSADRPDDLEFGLDLQRVWQPLRAMPWTSLRQELIDVAEAANAYFQKLGSGVP